MTKGSTISAADIERLLRSLAAFLVPYLHHFGRRENAGHAQMYLEGRLQRVERRTLEPIANEHGVHRRPLQFFVGAGLWDDQKVRQQLRNHVAAEFGRADGVLILDASGFPKKGNMSVGVQRQWCGRLGKEENCQVGEFLAYASAKGHTLVDCRLYLPRVWADDAERRDRAHVPKEIEFAKGWQLALSMLREHSASLPHEWVVGDDAYGRPAEFRESLDSIGERYLLEVPSNTQVLPSGANAERWRSVEAVANAHPAGEWLPVHTRDGEKGPIKVLAAKFRVMTRAEGGKRIREETLLITQRGSERWYYLSNAHRISVARMAKAAACRHYVEQTFELAKGDVGIDEYEVRSWLGWHHHMTLSLLALLFLAVERKQIKKNSCDNGSARSPGLGAHSAKRARSGDRIYGEYCSAH